MIERNNWTMDYVDSVLIVDKYYTIIHNRDIIASNGATVPDRVKTPPETKTLFMF